MKRFIFSIGILVALDACQPERGGSSPIIVHILDEDNQPTAARVRVTDLKGNYFAPKNHDPAFKVTEATKPVSQESDVILDLGRRFAYVDGQFSITLPHEKIRVEIVKGFEYGLIEDTVDLSSQRQRITYPLRKWFSPPDTTWYSGDVHVHYLDPESAHREMKAEDLNVCNVLISDFTTDHSRFRGDIEPDSDPKHVLYYGQEFREDRLGHVNILNLRDRLVEPSREPRTHQYPLNSSVSDEVHDQGGHISWAHFAAWPGLEGPMAVALKNIDAVELLCTIDPFHEPIFASDVVPEVRLNSGLRLWYRLLNCGFFIPATAGTDKMNNQVTVGANRVYAQVRGEFNYGNWIEALNAGRTFITNSPFLSLTVDQNGPGSRLTPSPGQEYEIVAKVWSQLPIDRLEIVVNGSLIAEKRIEPDERHAQLAVSFRPSNSCWIAARAYQLGQSEERSGVSFSQRRDAGGGPTRLNQYYGTLRPETTFAHTSPVYALVEGKPIRSSQDASYFAKYLENSIEWLKKSGKFPSDETRKEVLNAFEEGKAVFEALK